MNDEALPEVWISFDLVALEREGVSFDPDYVTKQLGIRPTQQNRIGDPIHKGKGRRTFTRWRISVGPVYTVKIDGMLEEVISQLRPVSVKLRAVCGEIGVEPMLTCAVEPRSAQTPDVTFPRSVVQWAAENNVELDVDIMLWRKEKPN
jgi:Domain of unknown function (DUF4279)